MWTTATVSLPFPVSPTSLINLGAYIRDVYRLRFAHELAAGTLRPLVIPYSLLGTFILPILYFCIPHINRPWLFRARYLLMAFIVGFNLSETFATSSANFAVAYAVGLMQAWGILWTGTLLIWMSPQFEAERVEKRKKSGGGPVASTTILNGAPREQHSQNGRALNGKAHNSITNVDGAVDTKWLQGQDHQVSLHNAPDEDIARSLRQGYEYYWQAYPADAPFSTRFEWSFDLVSSFRGTGWNWCVPILPRFAKAEKPLSNSAVDLSSIPLRTRQGYRRFKTGREWLRNRCVPMLVEYLALDLLSVLMMKDPYFILGPELTAELINVAPKALPFYLAALPPYVLFVYRGLICFSAILIAIDLIMTLWQMFCHFILGPRVLGTRAELWHYPCVYGSFTTNVLDKGMSGFWGGWWHQTFRTAFSAPGIWLSRRGYINPASAKGKALAGLLAFAQSGFLHSLGSVSCLPPSKLYFPPMFFLLCWVGILAQTALSGMLRGAGVRDKMPVWVRRVGNFGCAFAWLVYFQYLLDDDLGRAGIWMLEPVPVSLLRAAGLGKPGDRSWRWDAPLFPRWWVGPRWWEGGIAM
ncbi:hypothetical protein N0V93_003811 [Gnomoniopsis smithogilvyi]|uniref:Wax synthase domain-containing protein n=1 Tax=Gnomoniopsis smithogilvyi TaxID=1191159 RepID=A0A9W8YXT4_9PEZI|nr:hypothetical protein N0V93_003811 [Gnomoniopsis smithogilvyi]